MVSEAKNYKKLEGKYTVVGLDLDTTGRRLIDEIVHVAAYTPNDQFSQYIMPLMNLNPGARARHQIRVITVGFFRMLKSMVDYKVIKTKTEVATINEFLSWCEKINGTNEGVIFVYHEQMKFVPYMMIEVMKKYSLSERFGKIVKGFVNGYDLLDEEQANKLKYLSLTDNLKLQKEVLKIEKDQSGDEKEADLEGNASRRANLSYDICKYMSYQQEMKELDEKSLDEQLTNFIRSKAQPLEAELEELLIKEESLTRQAGMRDIFIAYFSASRYHRRRAVSFRRALADANHDKETLQELYNTQKREGLESLVKSLESIEKEDQEEFINILDCYFDEEKKPARPPTNPNAVGNNNNNNRRDSTSNNGGGRNGNNYNKGGRGDMRRRRHSNRNMQGGNGKENRGSRNNSRPRRQRPRHNSNRRFSGNGNVGHEMNQKMYKEHQVNSADVHAAQMAN